MATTANLRAQLEATLSSRVPAAFSLKIRQPSERFSTGIAEVDRILEGGIPRGCITEISGAVSTGRTSLALSILSGITQSGAACAWIDVHDELSPESAAASGIVLERLLWLRIKPTSTEQREHAAAEAKQPSLSFGPKAHYGGNRHPGNEMRGMDNAVSLLFKGEGGLLRDKTIGTPSRSNRLLSEPTCAGPLSSELREEQVAHDRLPARRGEYFLREFAENKQPESQRPSSTNSRRQGPALEKPWSRLERALKATDLLLQTGGVAAIVLDMSDALPQQAMRIPLASWYRFRLAAEQARTALILLTQSQCASSCAALALRCEAANTDGWSSGETPLFQYQHYSLIRERNSNAGSPRTEKKPPTMARWRVETEWTKVR